MKPECVCLNYQPFPDTAVTVSEQWIFLCYILSQCLKVPPPLALTAFTPPQPKPAQFANVINSF